MEQPKYILWIDSKPETAIFAYSWLAMQWHAFRLGAKSQSYFIKPWNAKRINICNYSPVLYEGGTATGIAAYWERVNEWHLNQNGIGKAN